MYDQVTVLQIVGDYVDVKTSRGKPKYERVTKSMLKPYGTEYIIEKEYLTLPFGYTKPALPVIEPKDRENPIAQRITKARKESQDHRRQQSEDDKPTTTCSFWSF